MSDHYMDDYDWFREDPEETDDEDICTCSYDGNEGYRSGTVDQTWDGRDIMGWFCPKCGKLWCREDVDCPPDEFGQVWRG